MFHGGWKRRLSHTHFYPGCHVALADHGCSQYTSIAAYDYSWFVSFPMTHGHFQIDFCDVIWNALYEYLVSFCEASMLGHGAGIGYTSPGWAPLTISVWWRGTTEQVWRRRTLAIQTWYTHNIGREKFAVEAGSHCHRVEQAITDIVCIVIVGSTMNQVNRRPTDHVTAFAPQKKLGLAIGWD